MTRRSWVATFASAVAGLFTGWAAAGSPEAGTKDRRTFRLRRTPGEFREAVWEEVAWGDMRPGDRIVAVSIHRGTLEVLAWVVGPEGVVAGSRPPAVHVEPGSGSLLAALEKEGGSCP